MIKDQASPAIVSSPSAISINNGFYVFYKIIGSAPIGMSCYYGGKWGMYPLTGDRGLAKDSKDAYGPPLSLVFQSGMYLAYLTEIDGVQMINGTETTWAPCTVPVEMYDVSDFDLAANATSLHILAQDQGIIYDQYFDGSDWSQREINGSYGANPKAPLATGNVSACYLNSDFHCAFYSQGGAVVDVYAAGGAWYKDTVISTNGLMDNGVKLVECNGSLYCIVTHTTGLITIHLFDSPSGSWKMEDSIQAPGGIAAVPDAIAYNSMLYVCYPDKNGNLWITNRGTTGWTTPKQVTGSGSTFLPTAPATGYSPSMAVFGTQLHICFTSNPPEGYVYDAYYTASSDSWKVQSIFPTPK